jgi:hypothetical protein
MYQPYFSISVYMWILACMDGCICRAYCISILLFLVMSSGVLTDGKDHTSQYMLFFLIPLEQMTMA